MLIIEPKVELWQQTDPIAHVAKCARVCYGSKEGKSTDRQLYDNLLKSKHNSMFRHESVYAIIPKSKLGKIDKAELLDISFYCPYIQIWIDDRKNFYIATNRNFMIDSSGLIVYDHINEYEVSPEEFANTEIGHKMMRYTFHITTQISTSRELNRVSPNAIAEKSTRYVDESDGVIVRPHWMSEDIAFMYNHDGHGTAASIDNLYLAGCEAAFAGYKALIKQGLKRQDARGVLPLDTATEVVYTYSVDEWRKIIAFRSDSKAHPNAQIIANMIKKELEELGYNF